MKLLDTSVLVDHLRGYQPATALLDRWIADKESLVCSECTRLELLAGARRPDLERVEALFSVVGWAAVTEDVARRAAPFAARFNRSHSGIDVADYLIAGTAEVLSADLVTTNVRHFPMFPDLQPPYSPERPARQ